MPELCRFYGIVIRIHIPDHPPPHFHALYSGQEALFDIDTLSVFRGGIPTRARRLAICHRKSSESSGHPHAGAPPSRRVGVHAPGRDQSGLEPRPAIRASRRHRAAPVIH